MLKASEAHVPQEGGVALRNAAHAVVEAYFLNAVAAQVAAVVGADGVVAADLNEGEVVALCCVRYAVVCDGRIVILEVCSGGACRVGHHNVTLRSGQTYDVGAAPILLLLCHQRSAAAGSAALLGP